MLLTRKPKAIIAIGVNINVSTSRPMSDETLMSLENDGIAIMGMIPADRYERIQGIKNGTVTIIRDTVEVEREGILKKAVNKVKDKIEERKDAKDNI